MKTDTLLVEVRTEELPPPAVRVLAEKFPNELLNRLREGGFTESQTPRNGMFATPRRFAALIDGVQERAKDRKVTRRGPQVKDGLDGAGKHSPALQGFMRAVGVTDVTQLTRETEKGREYFVWRGNKPGAGLDDTLAQMVTDSMRAMPDLPSMNWDANDYAFVRPVRGLVMMHGDDVIPGEVMGAKSGNETRGHPVLSKQPVQFERAEDYADTLRKANVIVDYDERAGMLNEFLENARRKARNAAVLASVGREEKTLEKKLEEDVVAMCEQPSGHVCTVGEEFWHLPDYCVASCLIKHQRCFPLDVEHEEKGREIRLSKFVFIADNTPEDPKKIIGGATAVVHARLQDLAFYLQTDDKLTEKEAREKLDDIVYHRKLGSQSARAERIAKIAEFIGDEIMKLNNEENKALKRAAAICKLDLPTMMVAEYPELAGRMAAYYFCENEERGVAHIVMLHDDFGHKFIPNWRPPDIALFLADKLEKIVGMFLAGEKPVGRKDPHGLRRAAAQMTKVLAPENWGLAVNLSGESANIIQKLSLNALLAVARNAFPADLGAQDFNIAEVHDFISKRVLLRDMNAKISNAVYDLRPDCLDEIPKRCKALKKFLWRTEASALVAANKRINNILRKSDALEDPPFDEKLLQESAEKALHQCVVGLEKKTQQLMAQGDYQSVLSMLATDAADPVREFFDKVMVNTEDEKLSVNRLALLARLRAQLNKVANLEHLSAPK